MPRWSNPRRFRVTTANQNPGVKFKEDGEVLEFIIDNRGPGTLYFSPYSNVDQWTGQRIPNGAIWIEDTCTHEGELFATSDQANTDFVFMSKT